MIDLIHEILNDHLVVIWSKESGGTVKVIKQENLRALAIDLSAQIEKEKSNES